MSSQPSPSRRDYEWRIVPAVVIIGIGVLFLLNNLGYPLDFLFHGNWWAWLILIAAIAPLSRAWELYRARGSIDAESTYYLLSAAAVVLVAVMFLAGLDWGTWWPLFVILGGLFTLVRRPDRRRYRDHRGEPASGDDATIR